MPAVHRRSSAWSKVAGLRPKRSVIAFACLAATTAGVAPSASAAERPGQRYAQTNLVSDIPGLAQLTDPNLKNPWGLSQGPTSPMWVANQGTSTSTLYPGAVGDAPIAPSPFVVAVQGGPPTGTVFNGSSGFPVGGVPSR